MSGRENMYDFVNFIRHADFSKVLELADRLKYEEEMREQRQHGVSAASLLHPRKKTRLLSTGNGRRGQHGEKDPNSFDSSPELIRSTLIPSAIDSAAVGVVDVMGRGESLITDSLIDETINSLANELKLCLDLKKQRRARRESHISETMRQQDVQDDDDTTNPIANKFTKWQTDILTNWVIEHREHPFPTHAQIYELAKATNLTETQVVNWTTNIRKRNLKGTVELEKKPHHFLDYLFLATDREKQMTAHHKGVGSQMDLNLYQGSGVTPRALTLTHQGNHEEHKSNRATDPPGRATVACPTSKAPTVCHPMISDHAFSQRNNQYEQPDIHRRHYAAIPRAQKNTKQIFRRGKQQSGPNESGPGRVKDESPARNDRAEETERTLLQGYAPNGVNCSGKFPVEDVGHYTFDEYDDVHPKMVSFESMCDEPLPFEANVPFDENMESYLRMIFTDE